MTISIEQAIYTSAETSRAQGYHLAAASPGIGEADLRELSAWGPSHDSLFQTGLAAESVNFHPLPSGACCISRTTTAGNEYSQRRGPRIYTQLLVVDREGLVPFGNNPWAVLHAAAAQGQVQVHEPVPARLEPIELPSDSPRNDLALLGIAAEDPNWFAGLLHAVITSPRVGIVAGETGPQLLAALFECLPSGNRADLSFTTGLRFSVRRPFRILLLPDETMKNRRLARQHNLTLLSRSGPTLELPPDGWPAYIAEALSSGKLAALAQQLAEPYPPMSLEELNLLGNRLREQLATVEVRTPATEPEFVQQSADAPKLSDLASEDAPRLQPGCEPVPPIVERTAEPDSTETDADDDSLARLNAELLGHEFLHAEPDRDWPPIGSAQHHDAWQRADGSHLQHGSTTPLIADVFSEQCPPVTNHFELTEEPARVVGELCPAASEQLQRLEDAIFEAMLGKPEALANLELLWPQVLSLVGRPVAEAAREQFLRYALGVWQQFTSGDDIGDPHRTAHAMDVVCLLFSR